MENGIVRCLLGLDIGSNSVGSTWVDLEKRELNVGVSVFPAGVEESDEKRGDPKNAKRRSLRRTRVTLARRAARKRELRLKLIADGLLPSDVSQFEKLLDETDPWTLRGAALSRPLNNPHEFGRILLHLAQRRGALGFDADVGDKGKVKGAITKTRLAMLDRYGSEEVTRTGQELRNQIELLGTKKKRTEQEDAALDKAQEDLKEVCKTLLQDAAFTFGRFIADLRDEWRTPITTPDRRKTKGGPREWRQPVRNREGQFRFHADRAMIRDEFAKLWHAQKRFGGSLSEKLTDDLRRDLDNDTRDSDWRHKGLLFGQRKATWDLGTLGRCVLEPTERCVPHADMYASRYLVVETVNNLKIIERGMEARALRPEERTKIKKYLSGPLGVEQKGKQKGQPKRSVTVSDLRELMGWGRASKTSQFRFNIESDEDRTINTDWFQREIVHGAATLGKWEAMSESVREGINRAILKHDPDDEKDMADLITGVMNWAGLTEAQADALVAAWKKRPRPDAKRLNMSRRAVRNLLTLMDREDPWPDPKRPSQLQWLTQIQARKLIAEDADFLDITTGKPLDDHAHRRYATGAKGATKRDRHYIRKHVLMKNGKPIIGPDGRPLAEPPPAPLITNPVVRKAIHEVRRHLVEYMIKFERKPDAIYIELSREARMGKKDADDLLFRNRLRNRIKNDISATFNLDSLTSGQQRAALERVVLCIHQDGICPLCGNQKVKTKITPKMAADGQGCEVAHIVPKACGGHNGLGNLVLAHTECNQAMRRRTPRQFWDDTVQGGFEEGMSWIEKIYENIERPKASDVKNATGNSLWTCYFTKRDDLAKIEQFKKDIKDIQEMTLAQDAATKYATRQVMAYLADAIFDGKGLPERGGDRLIFPTHKRWTGRFRREWGLFFDQHGFKAKGLTNEQEHERKEKDRGDHRHHVIDAIVTALGSRELQIAWEEREKQADREGLNTADEQAIENYRRLHPLPPPAPFKSREEFRKAVQRAVFGDGELERPVCHRPVKRKLIGALHKATQYGPIVNSWVRDGIEHRELVRERVTVRQPIIGNAPTDYLKPAHLRMPRPETDDEAIARLAFRYRTGKQRLSEEASIKRARKIVKNNGFTRAIVDPKPEKGGIVRDIGLRRALRKCLEDRGLNPDEFSKSDLKKSIAEHGPLTHDSGVPIRNVVLLWSNTDPVSIQQNHYDYATGDKKKLDDPNSLRLYDSQNNHHIEIRAKKNKRGQEIWSGEIVTAYEVAQRKLAKLRAIRKAGIPKPAAFRKLPRAEREKFKSVLRAIEQAHPVVDRTDSDEKGGAFAMSLCEGEMLLMKHKQTGEVGYFVIAKLDKPQNMVLVAHWDARAATDRKDANGQKVPNSKRDQFSATPNDLKQLAPPGRPHAQKVRVPPLGEIRWAND